MKQIISTTNAPAAIGAYSQAVVANGMLFASGQLGIDPATGEFAGADFRSQAEQAVKNVAAILEAAGTDASHVVKTTVFLTDMANFAVQSFFEGRIRSRQVSKSFIRTGDQ